MDSKPYSDTLLSRYNESCRGDSESILIKNAQTIEQGLGRSVRGEKDYCSILLIGKDLVNLIQSKNTRKYFSQQTRTQIELGIKIAGFAKEDINKGITPYHALTGLINQLLRRDEGWKDFYTEQMDNMPEEKVPHKLLEIFELEKKANDAYKLGHWEQAIKILQQIIDDYLSKAEEKGWYLQEMARYIYPTSKQESNRYQIAAHKKNKYLLKPREGMAISTISTISVRRVETIINWLKTFDNYDELKIEIDAILGDLRFGVESDKFEKALDELGKSLGFIAERPDKEWKEGPDNLWKLRDNQYLLVECKNKVLLSRKEIYKEETGQMNNACAWFIKNYGDAQFQPIIIIPTKIISRAAGARKKSIKTSKKY